jgi:ribosomal-protein-alanine N-acetyltransferase
MPPSVGFPESLWPKLPIRTPRLLLRLPRETDAEEIVRACAQRRVSRGIPVIPHPYRRRDAVKFVRAGRSAFRRRERMILAIARPGDDRLIGMIELFPNRAHRRAELGYWLEPGSWGVGYASEAGRAVCDLAFRALRLHRMEAGAMEWNRASLRVLQKLGFRVDGRYRDRFRIDRKWVTELRLSRVAGRRGERIR